MMLIVVAIINSISDNPRRARNVEGTLRVPQRTFKAVFTRWVPCPPPWVGMSRVEAWPLRAVAMAPIAREVGKTAGAGEFMRWSCNEERLCPETEAADHRIWPASTIDSNSIRLNRQANVKGEKTERRGNYWGGVGCVERSSALTHRTRPELSDRRWATVRPRFA
jgi:hypothetical protein